MPLPAVLKSRVPSTQIRADPGYHLEHFKVINAQSGEEYR